ncbi:MAG: hypothetical protein U5K51_12885 [Flavobacteriaceae bacterium]|nr:hypothetical protein [Flavobacteriaceae bacterium]
MKDDKEQNKNTDRRKFLKLGLFTGVTAVASAALMSGLTKQEEKVSSGIKMRFLNPDGKIVEVDADNINKYPEAHISPGGVQKGNSYPKIRNGD